MRPIKVLVVDDSAVVRQTIVEILSSDRRVRVLGAVADPIFAMQRMRAEWPDVIVLDIEMPRMDGLTFLGLVMAARPTPVVVCSSLTGRGAAMTFKALAAGAVTVVEKPRSGVRRHLTDASAELIHSVKAAAAAKVHNLPVQAAEPAAATRPDRARPAALRGRAGDGVVAIGASTGGPQALEAILTQLPAETPAILIVQHMPEKFTAAFAQRLDSICRISVNEAQDMDAVLPGRALVAPGGRHMALVRDGAGYAVRVRRGPMVNHHCPSVDVLFRSVADHAGARALGILLTGMGGDGALGLKQMQEAGARTVAQDEATCVVFGMPREAIKLGAADQVLALPRIAGEIERG